MLIILIATILGIIAFIVGVALGGGEVSIFLGGAIFLLVTTLFDNYIREKEHETIMCAKYDDRMKKTKNLKKINK